MVLSGEKKNSTLRHLSSGKGVSYRKIGLTTVAVTHNLLSGMPLVLSRKELIRVLNSILPKPGQPSAQLSKLIHHTACKKTKKTLSQWYRTVYIPWLVASYDTHKGKRWLNSNAPKPQGRKKQRSDFARFPEQLLKDLVSWRNPGECSMIDRFLVDAFGVSTYQFWSTVL